MICIMVLSHNGVVFLPPSVKFSLAALIFAGNMAINKIAKQIDTTLESAGITMPIAAAISNIPVIITIKSGLGKTDGTIRIKSSFLFPHLADAAISNIAAIAA